MQVSREKKSKQGQLSEFELKVSDEQKWEDIADEEFEVSSSYSPMDSYSPRILKIN